ncbi:peptidylprolyl isomerase [Marinifilum sp. D714]|uniref:peptidylprolyl isomerase n=1 Tax=Marinifilum sp. D714 TaxID=2937523 RepID=UPI0027C1C0D8|nr:peptidylprolyl isomerase [Marinifilum sp. D714]MDQ2177727.1 peptidylprolyl isomerase [Marinifilum sp. D714]
MRKGLLYLITVLYCSLASYGQYNSTDTLFSIDDTAYPSGKFVELFESKKLRDQNNNPLSLKESLDLYIDFHLKVTEAKKYQFDTLPEVIQEIETYHNKAFNAYLYPVKINQNLLEETFERIQYFVKPRHILVKIEGRATPKDTLEAYQEAIRIYTLLNQGKKFSKLANQFSDDLSARKNNGEIGYITAFDMDYTFETAAYNTAKGEYSKPVRSPYGYHIVQTIDKIKNPGKVRIRHLMIEFKKKNEKGKIKTKADSIYQLLQSGADISALIQKYSDDASSVKNNGILPWFGLFETHPLIEKTAFELKKKGDFSQPIRTDFGYHIIQLLDKKEYNTLEQCKDDLITLLAEDSRSRISERKLIQNLKERYQFKENKQLLSNFYSILDYAYAELWETLFSIENNDYSQEKFAEFLSKQASKDIYENFEDYINRLYVNFSNTCILAYHKKKLVEKHPKLKTLLDEYENGVLVYFITKKTIWDNTTEKEKIKEYYNNNQHKYKTDVDYKSVKDIILEDYRAWLEEKWSKELRKKYSVEINHSALTNLRTIKNE